jgi:hypothetical protein
LVVVTKKSRINVTNVTEYGFGFGTNQGARDCVVVAIKITATTATCGGSNAVLSATELTIVTCDSVAKVARFIILGLRCGACLWARHSSEATEE